MGGMFKASSKGRSVKSDDSINYLNMKITPKHKITYKMEKWYEDVNQEYFDENLDGVNLTSFDSGDVKLLRSLDLKYM